MLDTDLHIFMISNGCRLQMASHIFHMHPNAWTPIIAHCSNIFLFYLSYKHKTNDRQVKAPTQAFLHDAFCLALSQFNIEVHIVVYS